MRSKITRIAVVSLAGLVVVLALLAFVESQRSGERAILNEVGVKGVQDLQMAIITEGTELHGPGGPTYIIRDRKKLAEFYRRLTDPQATSPATGPYRYALVLRDNRAVLFNENSARDLVRHRDADHPRTYWTPDLLDYPVRHTPPRINATKILVYTLSPKGRATIGVVQLGTRNDRRAQQIRSLIQALANQYDPYAIQPTFRQPVRQLAEICGQATVFEVKLASPAIFKALILPIDVGGCINDPPETHGRLELIRADSIFISASDWDMMLAFRFGNEPNCVATPFITTRRIEGYSEAGGRILGEDLVKEFVRLTTAP